ncbi:MAG: ABC transporter ATP-binding protein [Armatimonadetes bacterium]|nr:ABC transporter ATP-binding protein [Armatimonadota bacterium]
MSLLELRGVTRRFGGLAAVSNITAHVDTGELVGLIGPNGAGKTTLFNLLTGVYAPSEGAVVFDGRDTRGMRPCRIAALGIARTFQNIRLFRELTALQNVKVAVNLRARASLFSAVIDTMGQRADDARLEALARECLTAMGLEHVGDNRSCDLPYGLQRRLEISRALATRPKLLLLDEPAAGMNPFEKQDLMQLIRTVQTTFNVTVLLIEHDMKVVMGICKRIYVLDYGQLIAEGTPAEIRANPKVIAAYLGEETI